MSLSHSTRREQAWRLPGSAHETGVLMVLGALWAVLLGASLTQDLVLPAPLKVWLLDVDAERGVYTWFSQLLLAGAAGFLYATARGLAARRQPLAWQWFALAALFVLLSLDEGLSLHERASGLISHAAPTSGFLYFAWVAPAAVFCTVGLLTAWPFIKSFPPAARGLLVISAGVFLAGAIGMEMVGSKLFDDSGSQAGLAYRLATNLEEGLEGLGVLLFLLSIHLYRQGAKLSPQP